MTVMACETPPKGVAAAVAEQITAHVPVLRTERLLLRAPRVQDFPVYAGIACSARAAGLGGPMSRSEAWSDFLQLASGWVLHGHGGWTIEDQATGEALGFVLIGFEPGDLEPELGYLVDSAAEGRGVAQDAAQAVLRYARNTLKRRTLVSYIAPDNTRSIRLAERLGAFPDGKIADADGVTLIYRHNLTEAH